MQISDERVQCALKKVAVLREQMDQACLGKPGPVLSVMDLHHVVQEAYKLSIEMVEVSFPAVHLRGHVERYEGGRAKIRVRADMAEVSKRLTTVKELCHLVLDEPDDWSTDALATLDAIIAESRGDLESKVSAQTITPLESEALALAAAIELLYPFEFRAHDSAKLAANETTISAIALHHEVPPFVVEEGLAKEPRFSQLREIAHTNLGIAAE